MKLAPNTLCITYSVYGKNSVGTVISLLSMLKRIEEKGLLGGMVQEARTL